MPACTCGSRGARVARMFLLAAAAGREAGGARSDMRGSTQPQFRDGGVSASSFSAAGVNSRTPMASAYSSIWKAAS